MVTTHDKKIDNNDNSKHDDAHLWDVLSVVDMSTTVQKLDSKLDHFVAERGCAVQ